MSIIISVKDQDQSSIRKRNQSIVMSQEVESNLNEEDFMTFSDKSVINLPKYLNANSNDLNKINFVLGGCQTQSQAGQTGNSNTKNTNTDDYKASTNERFETNSKGEKEREIYSANMNLNTSFISSGTNNQNYDRKISYTKETNLNYSNNGDYRNTLQTFNEKNIYDEINRAEAEKCFDQMDTLNNLSNIIINKTNNISKINRNLATENLFLYNCNNKNKNKQYFQKKLRIGLNNGFILDDNNNTVSQGSLPSIQNSEESRGKNGKECRIGNDNNKEDKKIYEISKKIENIKNSYNIYKTGTGSTSNFKNYESYSSSTNSIKEDKNGVELTCFQKICGGKK